MITAHLDFISAVGQPPEPHDSSVVPTSKPNINPNISDKRKPMISLHKPIFCNFLSAIAVPNVAAVIGP